MSNAFSSLAYFLSSRRALLVGALLFVLALWLYQFRMATSFTAGDTADYLSRAHTGALSERGNGLPLYITILNLVVRLPQAGVGADGIYANLLSVLFGALAVVFTYLAALRVTQRVGTSALGATCVLVSGLMWSNSGWIMPHISLASVSAWVLWLWVGHHDAPSRKSALLMGASLGLSFGLLPTNLLLLPFVVAHVLWRQWGKKGTRAAALLMLAFAGGILVNAALIAGHEWVAPTPRPPGSGIVSTVFEFLRGGQERGWFLAGLTPAHLARGIVLLPRTVGAELEVVGTILAVIGVVVGVRRRPALWAPILGAFVAIAFWVGVYPGDTRLIHGLGAYPIAGIWVALGATAVLRRAPKRRWMRTPLLLTLTLANIAVGAMTYRQSVCEGEGISRSWMCVERVPASAGDRYRQRAQRALAAIPPEAVVVGAAWDAAAQMNYLIGVRHLRPDLDEVADLSKLGTQQFRSLARPAWSAGRPVLLFGEWKDVQAMDPALLALFSGEPVTEALFELRPRGAPLSSVP